MVEGEKEKSVRRGVGFIKQPADALVELILHGGGRERRAAHAPDSHFAGAVDSVCSRLFNLSDRLC